MNGSAPLLALSVLLDAGLGSVGEASVHDDEAYWAIGNIFAAVVFIGCCIYCVFNYGFLLGVGLGWLPALICAAIARAVWPLLFIALLWIGWMIFGNP